LPRVIPFRLFPLASELESSATANRNLNFSVKWVAQTCTCPEALGIWSAERTYANAQQSVDITGSPDPQTPRLRSGVPLVARFHVDLWQSKTGYPIPPVYLPK